MGTKPGGKYQAARKRRREQRHAEHIGETIRVRDVSGKRMCAMCEQLGVLVCVHSQGDATTGRGTGR